MATKKIWEALWRLDEGAITTRSQAINLFSVIGQVTPLDPARYDLNQRGQWRPFDQERFIVDTLTQRTQVVTLAEDDDFEQGGSVVMVATGKREDPPQGLARWWESWPPSKERVEEWLAAIRESFEILPMDRFIMRAAADALPADLTSGLPRLVATGAAAESEEIRSAVGAENASLAGGAKMWVFLQKEPPAEWIEYWKNDNEKG